MRKKRFLTPLTWPALSFLTAIALGTVLLLMPWFWQEGQNPGIVDACFLATSAICVTGLTPVNVGETLNPLGRGLLLTLVQTGGLGVMTYTSLVFLLWRRQVPFTSREAVSDALLGGDFSLVSFLRQVTGVVLGIELVGAFFLWLYDPVFFHPFSALFHSVSAFCNAGFSLSPNNLADFRADWPVNVIICTNVFLGGIGFAVLREMLGICTGGRLGAPERRFSRFSRIVLKTSFFLILLGWALTFCIEYFRVGNEQTVGDGAEFLVTSFFQTVAARTAGFNIVNMSALSEASLLVLAALMFVGGAPGSCAGGIKVVAFRVLTGYIAAQFRGDRQIVLEGRGVPQETVQRALTLFFLYSMLIGACVLLLSITESGMLTREAPQGPSMLRLVFETISALGTVGLSADLTPDLTSAGKGILIFCMFSGRVGVLSLLMVVQSLQPRKPYTVAEAQLPVG